MINNDSSTIRASAVLTSSYVAATDIDCQNASQVYIYLNYTKGDETSCEVKVEYSYDDTTYFQETAVTTGATAALTISTYQMTATGKFVLQIPIMARWLRISVKASAGTPTGTLAIVEQRGNA